MPHLTFRNAKKETVLAFSKNVVVELAEIVGCDKERFTFNLIKNETFSNGEKCDNLVFVNINWFEKTENVTREVAKKVIQEFKANEAKDVIITFSNLQEDGYFKA